MVDPKDSRDKKQELFIELRAQGVTYENISRQLHVSKPTLISWSKKLHNDIFNLREIHRENLLEQFAISKKHRLELLSEQLNKVRNELENRDYSDVPTLALLNFALKIENRITREADAVAFLEEYDPFSIGNSKVDEWNG